MSYDEPQPEPNWSERDGPPWPPNLTRPHNRWQIRAGLKRWATVNTARLNPRPTGRGLRPQSILTYDDIHASNAAWFKTFEREQMRTRRHYYLNGEWPK